MYLNTSRRSDVGHLINTTILGLFINYTWIVYQLYLVSNEEKYRKNIFFGTQKNSVFRQKSVGVATHTTQVKW